MDLKHQKRRKPKLDRRNAIKNIDYEAPSSSSFNSYSSDGSTSLRTRSLDLSPYGKQTSFRIQGDEGEIDRICWSLGLSGPEDFAISTDAWEARKVRSTSEVILPLSRLHDSPTGFTSTNHKQHEDEIEVRDAPTPSASTTTTTPTSGTSVLSRFGARVRDADELAAPISVLVSASDRGGGIKGVRPPVLVSPPPLRSLPCDNHLGSSWDILKSFAPEEHDSRGSSTTVNLRRDTNSCSDDEEENEVKEIFTEDEEETGGVNGSVEDREERVRLGETTLLSESCSFSTSNDDDSSSTTTDPMYTISPNAKFKRNIKSWTKGGLLGSGSFGTVYEGFSDDGFFFAVKEVSLLDQGSQAKQSIVQLEQEISLLSQFEHENIVQYLGTDKDEEKLYIFLELVTQGSIARLYQRYHLQDSQVSTYTRQILHGLTYLHERDVVHRDIKCANILVDANGSVKLADFGLAKATTFNDVKSCKGTAFWMAPEVVRSRGYGLGYGLAADIWSLGCTVLEMLTRQLPYPHLECMPALFKIGTGEPPKVPDSLSPAARDFILKCLKVKPDERPTAEQLLNHSFVKRTLSASSGSASPSHPNWRRSS